MSKKVVAHSYTIKAVTALFCKYPPYTEIGKKYFNPSDDTVDISKYQLIDVLPDYQQLRNAQNQDLPYILHTPTNILYTLPRYGKMLECQELQQIAVDMGELYPREITEVPEGCTYWIDWESQSIDVQYPYKEVIRDLLEIVNSQGIPEDTTQYHIYTQKLITGEYTV